MKTAKPKLNKGGVKRLMIINGVHKVCDVGRGGGIFISGNGKWMKQRGMDNGGTVIQCVRAHVHTIDTA